MKNIWYYTYAVGVLGIADDGSGISDIFLKKNNISVGMEEKETALIKKASVQLCEYFSGIRSTFDLPLSLHGTDFQLRVWRILRTIPYGETRSYKQIAEAAGNPRACRAAGMANKRNPVMIVVPCHRVIGADGGLTGYACGLGVKKTLLDLEHR
jgi:methylated-DNA-[protein]-cysteine S-methyltransferase